MLVAEFTVSFRIYNASLLILGFDQKCNCKSLTIYQTNLDFSNHWKKPIEKITGKGENAGNFSKQYFPTFRRQIKSFTLIVCKCFQFGLV